MEADTGLVICGKLNKYTEDHYENHQRPGTPPNELNCLYLNARSVKSVTNERNKPVELQHILSTFEVHLVAITETWLTEDLLYSGILPQNMQCHRKDRSETRQSVRGGGLLLGIDNRLPSKRRPDLECECEILSISTGTVPIQLKKANVVPIFKKDDSKVFMSINSHKAHQLLQKD
ncbi:hypothetical protein CAPTEDRAFT_214732 [Capitella teleta]|uniref:Endonuclease/exonuclease/phosphatase domain-containing protein n=1 Tax=Capitella teleta TaxID=283909 RepID=R7VHU5_CAPTE|nr:hypothetical protein CAPTEDRAFT_214732 [Capitella teleta]|eukprot:ELU15260.1 hypothetical protein CAPTEDRAFT_214732 [Capitella teleta]